MPKTAIGGPALGAVQYGKFILTPPYEDASEEKGDVYWQGQASSSHVFDVPFKTNIGVKGKKPGDAMPIPYTNACGTCHVANELPFK